MSLAGAHLLGITLGSMHLAVDILLSCFRIYSYTVLYVTEGRQQRPFLMIWEESCVWTNPVVNLTNIPKKDEPAIVGLI